MKELNNLLSLIDAHFGGSQWFVFLLLGTGNIAGVALAIYLGGPSALFWMLMTAFLGMTTKMVEVTLSHKYREQTEDGTISGDLPLGNEICPCLPRNLYCRIFLALVHGYYYCLDIIRYHRGFDDAPELDWYLAVT